MGVAWVGTAPSVPGIPPCLPSLLQHTLAGTQRKGCSSERAEPCLGPLSRVTPACCGRKLGAARAGAVGEGGSLARLSMVPHTALSCCHLGEHLALPGAL